MKSIKTIFTSALEVSFERSFKASWFMYP